MTYIQRNREYVSYYADESPPEKNPILEVYTVDRASRIKKREPFIREQLEAECRVMAINQPLYGPDFWALEVHAPSATKWTALRTLLEEWNVPPTQVVAIGDDVNDIPMLEKAGLSFAMGNAVDEVKNVADRITEANHQEGVIKALIEVFPELSEQL
jgi:hydroxymethylpyrimidine pyrophosphatase-like HAD family hydrolase